ncbi:MAG: hypothetical protein LBC51_01975 [Treponema sp.]|jgi:hypothetical protein|nr:hypothetical protein [Treponema sp.]
MKKNHVSLWIGAVALIGSLWFMGCPTSSEDPKETTYSVITVPDDRGELTASPKSGPSGTEVIVSIKSKDAYYLDEVFVDGESKNRDNPVKVTLIDKDITVKAVFLPLPEDNYKVLLEQPKGGTGTISFSIADADGKEYGTVGKTVTLSNKAAEGYVFKNYIVDGAATTNSTFPLPARNVTVSGVFEKLADKSLNDLLTVGKNALKDGNVSVALNAFESAYAKDSNNPEALVYSSLGKLASIAWSTEVGNLFKDRLGLKYYPNTLDALINPESWFTYYPDQEGTGGSQQPPLNTPEWLTGKEPYTDSLVTHNGEQVASSASWPLILIANLIDKNSTGLNPALDGLINAVFDNPNFKEAEKRTASLKQKEPVKLDADIAGILGLSDFFGGNDVYVGWAELELLLNALKLVKATLLYVDSYNWTYDIGFVKDLPWDESILEGEQIDAIAGNLNKVLPLRTGFMSGRGGSYLEDSRNAYVEAINGIISVYDYYISGASKLPTGFKDTLNDYKSYRDEAVKAKNAIDKKESVKLTITGGTFTIDFGKFFTSGQLALDKFIETEGSDTNKSPVFYGFTGNTATKITSFDDFEKNYESIGFKISATPLGDIIGEALAKDVLQGSGLIDEQGYLRFDPLSGTIAWAVYHWDDTISEKIKELLK